MSQAGVQDLKTLAELLNEVRLKQLEYSSIVLSDVCDPSISAKFPKPQFDHIPPIFLHEPVMMPILVQEAVNLGVNFYLPIVECCDTKMICQTIADHLTLVEFLKSMHVPFHTHGFPNQRALKVVFKGLPNNVDLDNFKKALEANSIPVLRVHKMRIMGYYKYQCPLVLVLVPNNELGRKILQVLQFDGYYLAIEPLKPRCNQCYRCQKWGHVQQYCNGYVKCVKCAGDHLTKYCAIDTTKVSPKCANCGSNHRASFKLCPYSPTFNKNVLRTRVL